MRYVIFLIFSFVMSSAIASTRSNYCFDDAAEKAGVNRDILFAIAVVESNFNKNAVSKNKNGTEDVGLMQINTVHFKFLETAGIKRKDLFNACVNLNEQ